MPGPRVRRVSANERLDVVYCEGWDPEEREVVGLLSAATARARHRGGAQYAVVLRSPGAEHPSVLLECAWADQFVRAWGFDETGRRTWELTYLVRADGLLHVRRMAEWQYTEAAQPEFDEEQAHHAEWEFDSSGKGTETLRPQGNRGPTQVRLKAVEATEPIPVPEFGDWAALVDLAPEIELHVAADPEEETEEEPPWRPPGPLRPRHLAELVRAGSRFRWADTERVVEIVEAGELRLPSGRVVVKDPGYGTGGGLKPLLATVPPGKYPVRLSVLRHEQRAAVAAARLVITDSPVVSWEMARRADQDPRELGDGEYFGFGVDSGQACFIDADNGAVLDHLSSVSFEPTFDMEHAMEVGDPGSAANVVLFWSGQGDGAYPTWIGRDAGGDPACFLIDFLLVHNAELV